MFALVARFCAILSAVALFAGCHGSADITTEPLPGSSKQGFQLTVSPECLIDGGSAADFDIAVDETASGAVVDVVAVSASGLKALYLELAYDKSKFSPSSANPAKTLDGYDNYLSLLVDDEPGTVHYGQVLANYDVHSGFSGSGALARIEFGAAGMSGGFPKVPALVPTTDQSQTALAYYQPTGRLNWRYYSQGDYDQNGEVNIADLTPLGLHFGNPAGAPDTIRDVIDGDNNGDINIADITPIGSNFGNVVTAYDLYVSPDAGDYPGANDEVPKLAAIASVPLSNATGNSSVERLNLEFTDPAPLPISHYWVRPTDGADSGTPSLIAIDDNAGQITLALSATPTHWPQSGSGTEADPYVFHTGSGVDLEVLHSAYGVLSSNPGTTYTSYPAGATFTPAGNQVLAAPDPAFSGAMKIQAANTGFATNYLHFLFDPAPVDVLFGLQAATPPRSGAGTQTHPYLLSPTASYTLVAVNSLDPINWDVTDQTTFTTSDPAITVSPSGEITIGAGAPDDFNISAEHNGSPTTPPTRYFTSGMNSTLTLELDPAALQPTGGTGTDADPYLVERISLYGLRAVHSDQGDVTALGATFVCNTPEQPISAIGEFLVRPATGEFHVHAEYGGVPNSNVLYFTAQGAVQVTLEIDPASANQPTAGSGTSGDPFVVEPGMDYQLLTTHTSQGEVTSNTIFSTSNGTIATTTGGLVSVQPGVGGDFDVAGLYYGEVETVPYKLYFTVSVPVLTLQLDQLHTITPDDGSGTAADPYQVLTNAHYKVQVLHPVDGDVTNTAVFTPAYPLADGEMALSLGTGDFSLSAQYNSENSNHLHFEVTGDNQSPVADLVILPETGEIPIDVSLNASASDDPDSEESLLFSWQIDGVPLTGESRGLIYYYICAAATYDVEVTVFDKYGAFDTMTGQVQANASTGQDWHTTKISDHGLTGCSIGRWNDAGTYKPSVALCDDTHLEYHYASDVVGNIFTGVTAINDDVGTTHYSDVHLGLRETDFPAISYRGIRGTPPVTTNELCFNNASDAQGSAWDSTERYTNQVARGRTRWQLGLNSLLVFFARDDATLLVNARDLLGGPMSGNYLVEDQTPVSPNFGTAEVGGYPAIAYEYDNSSIWFKVAKTENGYNWSDPAVEPVNQIVPAGIDMLMADVPLISYVDMTDSGAGNTPLYILRANSADGQSWSAPAEIANVNWVSERNTAIAVINGNPAVACKTNASPRLSYFRSRDESGVYWDCIENVWNGDIYNVSMVDIDGKPCIAFNTSSDGGVTSDGTYFATFY